MGTYIIYPPNTLLKEYYERMTITRSKTPLIDDLLAELFEGDKPLPDPASMAPPLLSQLRCPSCDRRNPFENKDGNLSCWWCPYTGGWHDFPKT